MLYFVYYGYLSFGLRYVFPVSHSSDISMMMAVTRRRIESVFGKSPATLVLRLICVLSVSHMFEVLRRLRLCSGMERTARPSGMAFSIQWLKSVADFSYFAAMASRRSSACGRDSALKMLRISAATSSRSRALEEPSGSICPVKWQTGAPSGRWHSHCDLDCVHRGPRRGGRCVRSAWPRSTAAPQCGADLRLNRGQLED